MAQKRRTVNIQADLIDAVARAYEENMSDKAKALNPKPSTAQLVEGAVRVMIDFLERRLFYTEDLDSAAREAYERALYVVTLDLAEFFTKEAVALFGRQVRFDALLAHDGERVLGLRFYAADAAPIGELHYRRPAEAPRAQA